MKKMTLVDAMLAIAEDNMFTLAHIRCIEFEDGSGFRFNYSTTAGGAYYCEFNPATRAMMRNTYKTAKAS